MTTRTRRRAAAKSSVVIDQMPDGSTIYVVDEKVAETLPTTPIEVVEFKTAPVIESQPTPVLTCDSCGAKAGRGDDGKVVIVFQRKSGLECLDCTNEQGVEEAETKSQSMAQLISGPRGFGKRGKRRVINDDANISPSQLAVAHEAKRRGPAKKSVLSDEDRVVVSSIIQGYKSIAGFMDAIGMPGASDMRALLAATLKATAAVFPDEDMKAIGVSTTKAVPELTSLPELTSFADFQRAHEARMAAIPSVPTAQQIVDAKLAPFVVREAKAARFVERLFDQSFVMPSGYSTFEQAEYQLQKSFDAQHPRPSGRRKFQN